MHSIQTIFLLLYCILQFFCVVGQDGNAKIPAELLANALNHVFNSGQADAESTIQSLRGGDVDTLYQVAKDMNASGDILNSLQIWHHLADGDAHHLPAMISLGFAYSEQDKDKALKYFVQAGEDGPHQPSLFNAGRILVEMNQLPPGLAYVRAAATFGEDESNGEQPKQNKYLQAYIDLSRMMKEAAREMSLQDITEIFMYASINDFPVEGTKEDAIYDSAMQELQEYFEMKNEEEQQTPERQRKLVLKLKQAKEDLLKLQKMKGMSDLQEELLSRMVAYIVEMMEVSKSPLTDNEL